MLGAERNAANQYLRVSVNLLDDFYDKVGRLTFINLPEMTPLRIDLLTRTTATVKNLEQIDRTSDELGLGHIKGSSLFLLGDLYESTGQNLLALQSAIGGKDLTVI